MGRIFTWQQISCQQIPKLEAFPQAKELVEGYLRSSQAILGAVFFGSCVYGEPTVRSDLDCLVIYELGKQTEVWATLRELRNRGANLHVPIDLFTCAEPLLGLGIHSISPSFERHLTWAAQTGGCIRTNFFEGTRVRHLRPLLADFQEYTASKLALIEQSTRWVGQAWDSTHCRYLRRVMEIPIRVARKAVNLEREPGEYCEAASQVAERFAESAPANLVRLFHKLCTTDREYTALINEMVTEPPFAKRTYESHLDLFEAVTPVVYLFALETAKLVISNYSD